MSDSGASSGSSSVQGPYGLPPEAEADAAVLDAKGLRALAHPVRVQLVGLLRKNGPSTATRLAERLGVNSGTASYHLRQLAAAGFVEEEEERGNARERWWRSVHQSTWFNDPDLAAREPEAAMTYLQSVAGTYALRAQRVLNELQTMPRTWRETFDMSDWPLRLTPAEAAALHEELRAVVTRYRRDTPQEAARAPEGAERVSVILHLLPELDSPAAPTGNPGSEGPTGAETP
ncbi:helix-turn-helix domain-containing protein [Streptomyces sp. NPDC048196]|uniref:helix-turn-helix domain-containing protein n=1 Tax=Streptomyces sp. NPDC048196 TaxID=3154712 RepID=UPI0033CD900C